MEGRPWQAGCCLTRGLLRSGKGDGLEADRESSVCLCDGGSGWSGCPTFAASAAWVSLLTRLILFSCVCVCVSPWYLGERHAGSGCGADFGQKNLSSTLSSQFTCSWPPSKSAPPLGAPVAPSIKWHHTCEWCRAQGRPLGQWRADLRSIVCHSLLSMSPLTQCRPSGGRLLPPLAVRLCSRPPFPLCFGQRKGQSVARRLSPWRSQLCPPALVDIAPRSLFFHSVLEISISCVLHCER